jgi:hypothetical protein
MFIVSTFRGPADVIPGMQQQCMRRLGKAIVAFGPLRPAYGATS